MLLVLKISGPIALSNSVKNSERERERAVHESWLLGVWHSGGLVEIQDTIKMINNDSVHFISLIQHRNYLIHDRFSLDKCNISTCPTFDNFRTFLQSSCCLWISTMWILSSLFSLLRLLLKWEECFSLVQAAGTQGVHTDLQQRCRVLTLSPFEVAYKSLQSYWKLWTDFPFLSVFNLNSKISAVRTVFWWPEDPKLDTELQQHQTTTPKSRTENI